MYEDWESRSQKSWRELLSTITDIFAFCSILSGHNYRISSKIKFIPVDQWDSFLWAVIETEATNENWIWFANLILTNPAAFSADCMVFLFLTPPSEVV